MLLGIVVRKGRTYLRASFLLGNPEKARGKIEKNDSAADAQSNAQAIRMVRPPSMVNVSPVR